MFQIPCKNYPVIIFDQNLGKETRSGKVLKEIITELEKIDINIYQCISIEDVFITLYSNMPLASCIMLDWDSLKEKDQLSLDIIKDIREINDSVPIFILSERHEISDIKYNSLNGVNGYIWKYGDTSDFIAGRIKNEVISYLDSLYGVFFKSLMEYSEKYKYAWHTPGHMGGVAFIKSPHGKVFFDYMGENVFRTDLSTSVTELGSLQEHTEITGQAEEYAAEAFGADRTYFVTNGTSTSNKMVIMSVVTKDDIVLVDRNCHKSVSHALMMSQSTPIYLKPRRNAYGIIGLIPRAEFQPDSIKEKIEKSPLIKNKSVWPKLLVLTNSTYDGLIYNVNKVKKDIGDHIPYLHFDEAWYAYAKFHPFYTGKFGMSKKPSKDVKKPTIFATQSTHKLLAAFSQASMIHVKYGDSFFDHDLFNETFMMHTSTSPQYTIIASLDVASHMMNCDFGKKMINESMLKAIEFRKEIKQLRASFHKNNTWFFDVWQPESVKEIAVRNEKNRSVMLDAESSKTWTLQDKDAWHGFNEIDENYITLDPIKVTILTPGISKSGKMEDFGIPAPVVSLFLVDKGVVDEKTGFYNLLFLFSMGVNKSKATTLLSTLIDFRNAFEKNVLLDEIFPELVQKYPGNYKKRSIKDLCEKMHEFLKNRDVAGIMHRAYDILPEQVITPNKAYRSMVKGNFKDLFIEDIKGEVVLTMVAPYPPGIPLIMPGEKITEESADIIEYLKLLQDFDNEFPGFENEVHGAEIKIIDGKRHYVICCAK